MNAFRIPMRFLLLSALVALASALAGHAHAAETERSRIAQERAEIEARYAERERACRDRFVVTSCVDDAKRDRRSGLDALRARQLELDEQSRRERTAARRAELAAKATEDARRDQERAARAASAPKGAATGARPLEPRREPADTDRPPRAGLDRPLSATDRLGIKPTVRGSAEERREREERSRAGYEARLREAAEHRQQVTEQARKRLKDRPPAAPLPVPGTASSAR